MAVIETNQSIKARLEYQKTDPEATGGVRKVSKTVSNLAAAVDNDSLMAGMTALATLITDAAATVVRVDEAELANE